MYRRYTLDEIKRKIIDVLQSAGGTGLSGVELADRIGINRMTITKYLDVMHAMGLLKKKKIGNVNIWFVQIGAGDIEFPINYIQVQQKLISAILAGDEDHARRILLSLMNSNVDQVRVMTDVVLPAVNTIGELYSRGRLNKTERTFLLNLMMELIDLVKFNVRPREQKANAHAVCVAGSEDRVHVAKGAAVALLARGWDSSYIGDVGEQIDPFFDIDFIVICYVCGVTSTALCLYVYFHPVKAHFDSYRPPLRTGRGRSRVSYALQQSQRNSC